MESSILCKVIKEKFIIYYCKKTKELPAYVYTVGLQHNFDHPELILVGEDDKKQWMLDFVNDKCIRIAEIYEKDPTFAKCEFRFGKEEGNALYKTSQFLMNIKVKENNAITTTPAHLGLVRVCDKWKKAMCRRAYRFYLNLSRFNVVQLITPDINGFLPWDLNERCEKILLYTETEVSFV